MRFTISTYEEHVLPMQDATGATYFAYDATNRLTQEEKL